MLNAEGSETGQKNDALFSPRFRSVAAMAGWDEEALMIASLVVEDTPDRQLKHNKRSILQSSKTPPTNSRRKRRSQQGSPASRPVAILNLDEDEPNPKQESEKISKKETSTDEVEKKSGIKEEDCKSTSAAAIPCIDKLREELSCAICLEICYEPSTTPCGHSFCKKCLGSAADKCGKRCPKCRQLISNSRYCTVNTVLWNTIQLLFPQDVEARKNAAAASEDSHERKSSPARISRRIRAVASLNSPVSERRNRNHHHRRVRSQRELPSQDEDAALALRLQREEFMEAFNSDLRSSSNRGRNNSSSSDLRSSSDRGRNSTSSSAMARANLRAMASRAINIRIRGHTPH